MRSRELHWPIRLRQRRFGGRARPMTSLFAKNWPVLTIGLSNERSV